MHATQQSAERNSLKTMRKSLWFTSSGGAARISIIALACLFLSATGARADSFTYTYTGNPFSSANAPYTTSDKVTGMFELSAALPANLNDADESSLVISYTLQDGEQTISSLTALTAFGFTTNSAGTITGWTVIAGTFVPTSIFIKTNTLAPGLIEDVGQIFVLGSGTANAQNMDDPGSWSFSETTVPEPGSLIMMFSGLLGLGLLVGMRRCLSIAQ